jgi:hypothetical protein
LTREFPQIVSFGSAFRFALEVEAAAGELAAAARGLAPDETWRAKLEELVGTHDARVSKLTTARQEVNEMILEPISGFDGSAYLKALGAEPVKEWPAIVEQLIEAEEEAAGFELDFVEHAEDMLAATGRVFKKAAKQNAAAATALREMLD